jgi:AraC family transcriptional regulator
VASHFKEREGAFAEIPMRTHLPLSFGNSFARCFYMEEAPSILMRPLSTRQLAATRLTCEAGLPDPSASVRPESAFTVSVHLKSPRFRGWGTWVAGRFEKVESWYAGGIGIYDLESDPIAFRPTEFDSVHYNVPRTTLDAFTEENDLPYVRALACKQGAPDAVIYHLTQALLPGLESNAGFSDLFLDHFVQLLVGRLVEAYSEVESPRKPVRGGLAPWQMSRARDLLNHQFHDQLTLPRLAKECGLSVSHFTRSFRQSFGCSAHRYLMLQRVERAKTLLTHSDDGLAQIGLKVGFSDQAAFSRTFRSVVGVSPGKWRSEHRARKASILEQADARQAGPRAH